MIHSLREAVIEDISHGGRYPVKNLSKYLLFRNDEELNEYFTSNGISVGTRVSKSTKEEVYTFKEGEIVKERAENRGFILETIMEKRDKKYFLVDPE